MRVKWQKILIVVGCVSMDAKIGNENAKGISMRCGGPRFPAGPKGRATGLKVAA